MMKSLAASFFTVIIALHSLAYDGEPAPLLSEKKPAEFNGMGITEKLGQKVNLSLPVVNEDGVTVPLSSFYDGRHPVVLSLVYYSCPGLCNLHLNGAFEALQSVDWKAGEKFQYIALSFDPRETPATAKLKKEAYMKQYKLEPYAAGFHFLTATQSVIDEITKSVGFEYKWMEAEKEWGHASAAIVTTPTGEISRYHHGVMFNPKDLKLSFNEATNGRIGTIVDKLIMYCFKYDPTKSTYSFYAFRAVQIGAAITVIFLGLFLFLFWLRSRKEGSAA